MSNSNTLESSSNIIIRRSSGGSRSSADQIQPLMPLVINTKLDKDPTYSPVDLTPPIFYHNKEYQQEKGEPDTPEKERPATNFVFSIPPVLDKKKVQFGSHRRAAMIQERSNKSLKKKEIFEEYSRMWLQQTEIPFTDTTAEYDILRQVGKGTFSSVYIARHAEYHTPVALKIIDKKRVTDTSDVRKALRNVRRVNNEVNLMRECRHDGICSVLSAFQTNQHVFIIMDFVERDLFHLLSGFPSGLPEKLQRSLTRIIGISVAYLHKHGISHRDLKPENLLIQGSLKNGDLMVKICDFGLSLKPATLCTDFVGSPGFFAPEILIERAYNAFKADVWSFGAVCLETFIGTPAFGKTWLQAYGVLDSRSVFAQAVANSIQSLETNNEIFFRAAAVTNASLTKENQLASQEQIVYEFRHLLMQALDLDWRKSRVSIDTLVATPWLRPENFVTEEGVDAACLKILRMTIEEGVLPLSLPADEEDLANEGGPFSRRRREEIATATDTAFDIPTTPPGSTTRKGMKRRTTNYESLDEDGQFTNEPIRIPLDQQYTLPAMTICHLDDSAIVRRVIEVKLAQAFPCHRLVNFADSTHLIHTIIASQQSTNDPETSLDDPLSKIRLCIFDEHIREHLKGSDLAHMLIRLGYKGLILCMTADETPSETNTSSSVYDGYLSKEISTNDLHKSILDHWIAKFGQGDLVTNALLAPSANLETDSPRCDFRDLRKMCLQQILKTNKPFLRQAELLEIKGDLESVNCSKKTLDVVRNFVDEIEHDDALVEIPFTQGSQLFQALDAELFATCEMARRHC